MSDDLCLLADVKSWLGLGTIAETKTIPATTSYTVTVGKATAFIADSGVIDLSTDLLMTKVAAGLEASGKYSVAAGVYTFSSHDASKSVGITYQIFTADDVLLARVISSVSESIRSYTQAKFSVDTYAEVRSGVGYGQMVLSPRITPIASVTALTIDGKTIPAVTGNIPSTAMNGYLYTADHISLFGYEFTRGRDNILLTYDAGYSAVPDDIVQAAVEWTCFKYREKDRIGHSSKSLAGETVSFIVDDAPKSVLKAMNRYRKVIPV